MRNGNWFTKGLMVVALFLAYMKTSEAMVHFAPRLFLGWSDPILPVLWAYVCAGMVEGVALYAFYKWAQNVKDTPTRTVSIIVTLVAVAFSISMNILDQKINDGSFSLNSGVPIVGFLFSVMGLIPIITALMFGAMELVDAYFPDHDRGGGKQKQRGGGDSFGMDRGPNWSVSEPRRDELPAPMQARMPQNGKGGGQHLPSAGFREAQLRPTRSFENDLGKSPRLVPSNGAGTPEGEAGEHPTPPRA